MKRGFEPCGRAPDPEYLQAALFQKPVLKILETTSLMSTEPEAAPGARSTTHIRPKLPVIMESAPKPAGLRSRSRHAQASGTCPESKMN